MLPPTFLYYKIKKQRASIQAPVDTMGCGCVRESLPRETRKFHILISLLLSSQTRDEYTYRAMKALDRLMNPMTPEALLRADRADIFSCIKNVVFNNKKVDLLYDISEIVLREGMPRSFAEALKLPGVGKKMASLYSQHALGQCVGIAVDTHVHRISNRIGLVNTGSVDKTKHALEALFDIEEWPHVNKTLVGFGQVICTAVNPQCKVCSVRSSCPASTWKPIPIRFQTSEPENPESAKPENPE